MNAGIELEARSLYKVGFSEAPEEWKDIPAIAEAKPHRKDPDEVSLQKISGLVNVCAWAVKNGHLWTVGSDFFKVSKKKVNKRIRIVR